MVDQSKHMDRVLTALANGTRRELLRSIGSADATVSEMARKHPMSLAAVSKHLQVLERAGLIQRTRKGREFHFTARRDPLDEAMQLLEDLRTHWTNSLDELAKLVEEQEQNPKPSTRKKRKSQ